MADFWISDTHFRHANIVRGCSQWDDVSQCRDFATVDEHDATLLDRINSTVGEHDRLWHVGDFSFGNVSNVAKFRGLIRCKHVMLAFGNHDKAIRENRELRDLFTECDTEYHIFVNKQEIWMHHCPWQVWPGNQRGAWMLHGHSHGHVDHASDGKILDLCPEDHDSKPWSFDQIEAYMAPREIVAKDHHRAGIST